MITAYERILLNALRHYEDIRNYDSDGRCLLPESQNIPRHHPVPVDKGSVAREAISMFEELKGK